MAYRTDTHALRLTKAFENALDDTVLKLGNADEKTIAEAVSGDFLRKKNMSISDKQLNDIADHIMPLVAYFLRTNEGR